ncbi:egg cell-secreted protein 1.2-like [Phragmites australis]|uniref:egg cell-secreted protein 1.2-like n=1 Tax=Phragmites australis TaxID=29695 RepID=UPI002D7772EE|nr:egg cell-secreted protein 1.2-like [Phragmites australis]
MAVPPLLQLAVATLLLIVLAVAPPAASIAPGSPVPPLVARLHAFPVTLDGGDGGQDGGGGGFMECWDALVELRSCTNEIVLFFVNGESYIGPECCLAIRGATRHCWPAMLASVGFTAQEADVLRGFCDAEAGAGAQAPPPAVPAPAPAPGKA